jgi:subtilisin-like proprotein convertase family protein
VDAKDPVVQTSHTLMRSLTVNIPATILNFDGIPFPGVGCSCSPPDTNGVVGTTQYVQMVNEGSQVFNKTTGASVLGPVSIVSLWSGFGGVCESNGNGDPVVLYDHLANRWIITQFAGTTVPTDECIAVSTTSDATGTYNRYAFHLGTNFFDYPHLSVWPDAYYMSMNVFNTAGTAFLGPQPFAFDRSAMLTGAVATFVTPGITVGPNEDSYLSADLDGAILPPAGTPNSFVEFPGSGSYKTWHFHADFVTPGNTTFTLFASPAAAGFSALCPSSRSCVPQPGSAVGLDGIGDRLMFRLGYRKFADGHESVVGTYNVSSGGVSGIRWFELRNVSSGPEVVFQESTYQPDTTWRWLGSTAMDADGNIAIGYSVSSGTVFPGIRYAGRLATDPLNALTQGEAVMVAGSGIQTSTGNRWGDYSAMTIDPVDDHTFWFTSEYYNTTASVDWKTRIGSFKFPPAVPTPQPGADTSNITADNCNSNGVIDPNELVTVSFGIKNTGTANTSNLVATLQATGGVTSPSGPQTYGVVTAGGATVFKSFTFTAGSLACGSTLTATFQLQDGATNFGNITYTFQVGSVSGGTTTVSYSSGNTAVAIPDNNPVGVDIPIIISDTGSITDVNVSVRLNHTFDGDLAMTLIAPDNTAIPLVTNRGGAGANFGTGTNDCSGTPTVLDDSAATAISAGAVPFAGSFKPESLLSILNGKNLAGTWKLHVVDSGPADTGTVGCFTLQIARHPYTCCGFVGTPAIVAGTASLTAENFTPVNGAPDPGELVTVSLPLNNTGTGNTTNLVGTLQATGGVTSPSGPQTYGIVISGGAPVARSFSFIVSGTCGNNITLTLALQDGATNLGTITYTLRLGTPSSGTIFSEAFDGVSAPALPAGWTTTATGGEVAWVTSTTSPNTAPNDAFAPDVASIGNTEFVTPTIAVPAGGGQVTFKNLYNMEASTTAGLGYDGMVLEVSINGGAFADITATGNAFSAGGYSRTISSSFSSPLAGRSAWSGLSGGTTTTPTYITSTINLPAAAAGQNIKLKWRAAADSSAIATGTAGVRIDGIVVTGSFYVCVSTQAPSITNGPPPSPVIVGTPYSFTFVASGNPPPTFSSTGTFPPGLALSAAGVLSGTATSGGNGSFPGIMAIASNGVAPDAMQTFSLTTVTQAQNYLAGFGLSGGNATFTFDYDGDGLANLLEYGLGLNPTVAGLNGLPVVTLKNYSGTKYLSMTFNRSSLATDLTYIVQGSSDLTNWTDLGTSAAAAVTSGTGFVVETGAAPTYNVEVRDTVPYDPNGMAKRFMRLKITSP